MGCVGLATLHNLSVVLSLVLQLLLIWFGISTSTRLCIPIVVTNGKPMF